jgi:hypothetical protein
VFWWVVDEQVDMLGFAVHLDKFSLEVQANLLEYDFELFDSITVKYLSSVLCDEDQMDME